MIHVFRSRLQSGGLRAGVLACCAVAFGACNASDRLSPTSSDAPPTLQLSTTTIAPGIVFASFSLEPSQLNSVHTGLVGSSSPSTLLTFLAQVKPKGGRVIL